MPASVMQRLQKAVVTLGPVHAQISFWRDEAGRFRVGGEVDAEVVIQCQRCLKPYAHRLGSAFEAAVVWSDEQARQLPAELEPWLASESGLALVESLEDELLLTLPTMPLHELSDCEGLSRYSSRAGEQKFDRDKPFAVLGTLKKDSGKIN